MLEVFLAVGTSSAIAAWAIWKTGPGTTIWAILAGAATLVAIVKPLLQLPNQIQTYTKLFTGLGDLYFDLTIIFHEIKKSAAFETEQQQNFELSMKRLRELQQHDEPRPNTKLLKRYYEEVNKEIPPSSLSVTANPYDVPA